MRLISLPAFVVGVALAIVFFKIYGVLTRPDVPAPVAFVVSQFAPGVELGARVNDVRPAVRGMTYARHLGYVGLPNTRPVNLAGGMQVSFSQVWLLLDAETREQSRPDPRKARVDAVEVLTTEANAPSDIAASLSQLFRNLPLEGCVARPDGDGWREVRVWSTPNERGGVALVSDPPTASPRYAGLTVTHVVAFRGRFAGARTLRANYHESPCARLGAPAAD